VSSGARCEADGIGTVEPMSTPQGPLPPEPSSPDPWATGPAGQPNPQAGYPQPGYPQPGYSQPPYPPAGQHGLPAYTPGAAYGAPQAAGPHPAPPRPASVTYAFWTWMATMVLGIVGSLLLLTGDYLDRVQQS